MGERLIPNVWSYNLNSTVVPQKKLWCAPRAQVTYINHGARTDRFMMDGKTSIASQNVCGSQLEGGWLVIRAIT